MKNIFYRKGSLKKLLIFFILLFVLSASGPCLEETPALGEDIKSQEIDTAEFEKKLDDMAKEIEETADQAEEKITELTTQFDKIIDIFEKKYKDIAPKIQKIISTIEERLKRISERYKSEDKSL